MGPLTLFDKSFLQMLNADEAAIFDALYSAIVCPIFYVETLADLAKAPVDARSAERVVGDIAGKTPSMHSYPTTAHWSICLGELAGYGVRMERIPVREGGKVVRQPNGDLGIIYGHAPEEEAFNRWQRGNFQEVERDFASSWRATLATSRNAEMAKLAKAILAIHNSPKNLDEALAMAKEVVESGSQQRFNLRTAYALLGFPPPLFNSIEQRWIALGRPLLTEFAPYMAHCLTVDVFFHVAVDKGLIDPGRASNRVDMYYLYYLPFCMAFVSNDRLHGRTAPLFLKPDQCFINGEELKRDLAALDRYYSTRPDHEREQGLFRLAGYPPPDDNFLTTRIWKQFDLRTERPPEDAVPGRTLPKEAVAKLIASIKHMETAAKTSPAGFTRSDLDGAKQMVISRRMPMQRGKWRIMPPEVKPTDEKG